MFIALGISIPGTGVEQAARERRGEEHPLQELLLLRSLARHRGLRREEEGEEEAAAPRGHTPAKGSLPPSLPRTPPRPRPDTGGGGDRPGTHRLAVLAVQHAASAYCAHAAPCSNTVGVADDCHPSGPHAPCQSLRGHLAVRGRGGAGAGRTLWK